MFFFSFSTFENDKHSIIDDFICEYVKELNSKSLSQKTKHSELLESARHVSVISRTLVHSFSALLLHNVLCDRDA